MNIQEDNEVPYTQEHYLSLEENKVELIKTPVKLLQGFTSQSDQLLR